MLINLFKCKPIRKVVTGAAVIGSGLAGEFHGFNRGFNSACNSQIKKEVSSAIGTEIKLFTEAIDAMKEFKVNPNTIEISKIKYADRPDSVPILKWTTPQGQKMWCDLVPNGLNK